MEDYILREIDRIGKMLQQIAERLGLFKSEPLDYTLADIQTELGREDWQIDLEQILQQEHPIAYLVTEVHLSDQALESLVEILFYAHIEEQARQTLLEDAVAYLDGKGYFSFKLHALLF